MWVLLACQWWCVEVGVVWMWLLMMSSVLFWNEKGHFCFSFVSLIFFKKTYFSTIALHYLSTIKYRVEVISWLHIFAFTQIYCLQVFAKLMLLNICQWKLHSTIVKCLFVWLHWSNVGLQINSTVVSNPVCPRLVPIRGRLECSRKIMQSTFLDWSQLFQQGAIEQNKLLCRQLKRYFQNYQISHFWREVCKKYFLH